MLWLNGERKLFKTYSAKQENFSSGSDTEPPHSQPEPLTIHIIFFCVASLVPKIHLPTLLG